MSSNADFRKQSASSPVTSTGNNDCLKLSGLDDFWVLDSRFERCGGGGSGSGVDHVGCHHGVLAHNDFLGDPEAGNAIQCKGGSGDLLILANLITDPGQRAVNMGGSTGYEYNLIVFDRSAISTWINVGGNTAPETFTFANNLWYATNDPAQSEPNLPVTESGGIYGQDPGLDVNGASFGIESSSPAAGAGIADDALVFDRAGACYTDPPSIGAHEAGG